MVRRTNKRTLTLLTAPWARAHLPMPFKPFCLCFSLRPSHPNTHSFVSLRPPNRRFSPALLSSLGKGEEANHHHPSKRPSEEDKNSNPSKTPSEEANNNMPSKRPSGEAKNNHPSKILFKEVNNTTSKRPPEGVNNNVPRKKLSTFAVQATGASQNTSGMKIFGSAGEAARPSGNHALSEAMKEYQEFEEKVKRTVYLDNLSHQVTESVIKTALSQFGAVSKVIFLENYTIPFDIPQSALVEMETNKDAESVVNMLQQFPFMMSGMPRPVRARHAMAPMFLDRPRAPGRTLVFRWVGRSDPDYEGINKSRLLAKRQEVENLALIKHQMEEEQQLAKQQQENLNSTYKKLEAVEGVILTGQVNQLCRTYGISLDEVF